MSFFRELRKTDLTFSLQFDRMSSFSYWQVSVFPEQYLFLILDELFPKKKYG